MALVLERSELRDGRGSGARVAIELRGVAHKYTSQSGLTDALGEIDLSLERGSFVAVLGPSGCGKTTLLRALSGLLAPTSGVVLLDGEEPASARKRRAIGWLAQDDGLLPWLRVADNVALPLVVGRSWLFRQRVDRRAVDTVLGRV